MSLWHSAHFYDTVLLWQYLWFTEFFLYPCHSSCLSASPCLSLPLSPLFSDPLNVTLTLYLYEIIHNSLTFCAALTLSDILFVSLSLRISLTFAASLTLCLCLDIHFGTRTLMVSLWYPMSQFQFLYLYFLVVYLCVSVSFTLTAVHYTVSSV